jgi:hypothetical protein
MKHNKKRIYILGGCLFLTLLIAITFFPLITYDYIGYDDSKYVAVNPYVQEGFNKQSIYWALTSTHTSNWHPLTWFSYMMDSGLFGNKPGIYHWMNLNYHIVNAVLIFLILVKMTGHILRSMIVAAFFAIHPIHVESVAWISERKDVLSTCMILFSLYAYVNYVQKGKNKDYFWVLFFFLLSLTAKPMMVSFPFVLLLLDHWPLSRIKNKKLIFEKIPLFLMSFIFCLITLWTQHSGGSCQSLEEITLTIRILNAVAAYGWYVSKLFVPLNLAIFYPHPLTNISFISILWGAIILISGIWSVIRFRNSFPYITTGFLWFLITLVPVIGLVQVGFQAYADRYSYIPLTGLFIIITWGLFDTGFHSSTKNGKKWATAFLLSIIFVFTHLCGSQVRTWQNGTSVFKHALKVVPDNYVAMTHLGTIQHLKNALQLRPNYTPALYNLGTALIREGKLHEALNHLLKAEQLNANHPYVYNNLGGIYYQLKNYPLSLKYFKKALELDPGQESTKKNIKLLLKKMPQKKDDS